MTSFDGFDGRFVVREARPEEAERIAEFQLRMARETEGLELDPARVRAGVRAVFDDPRRGRYWVVEGGGELLGCLLTTPEWSDWRAGWVLWIQSVYVVERARGQGLFRRLYERLRVEVEADPSLCGLRLYVDRRNRPAQEVYARVGMSADHYLLYEWLE